MRKRTTIKDIADKAGVSIATVHCALSGKQGVGEATRLRIVEIARQHAYRPNVVAASLNRKAVRIAAAFPGPAEDNRFYFTYLWNGIRDYLGSVSDFNIELVEVPYYKGVNNQADELANLFERTAVDGLLTVGYLDDQSQAALARFVERDIPVILIGNDLPESGRLCCVQPNYNIIGRTLAELLTRQIPRDGEVLLFAGNVTIPSHYLIVLGFEDYLREHGLANPVHKLHGDARGNEAFERLCRELTRRPDLAAAASVNAKGSVLLGRALRETGMAGGLAAVGSDIFAENIAFLRDGVFTNLLNKNPYSQSSIAAKCMVDYLLRDVTPLREVMYVGSEVVFQSGLPMYDPGSRAGYALRV